MKPLTSEDFPPGLWTNGVAPSIRETVNSYWRTVETTEDLQAAWQDLQAQLLVDRTVNPLMHDATRAWAEAEMRAMAKRWGVDEKDAATASAAAVIQLKRKKEGFIHGKDTPLPPGVSLNDFRAYMPMHSFIFAPSREMWPASSVNSRIPPVLLFKPDGTPDLDDHGKQKTISASAWIDRNQPVEQMTWAPGLPMLIQGRLVSDGGWIEREGVTCFNLYRAPTVERGDPAQAGPWLDHVRKIYPDDADHIIKWLAHRVQRPQQKINHALVVGGEPGIGKDTLFEPVKYAVGPWNFQEVTPTQTIGRFNSFLKSVIMRVSEARDLGDLNRYQFYDHMKIYTAAPPDVLRIDEKNLREHSIFNCCGVILTTNYKEDGIYLPGNDRRHFVAWSDLKERDFGESYWNRLWNWYRSGGIENVCAYLAELDISEFDPKAPPPKTPAFWAIVAAGLSQDDADMADLLDTLGQPDVITLDKLKTLATGDFGIWIRDPKNRRSIPHRMEQCGYVRVHKPGTDNGLWKVDNKRQAVYAKKEMVLRDQLAAVNKLVGEL